jgi:hypothetical protein
LVGVVETPDASGSRAGGGIESGCSGSGIGTRNDAGSGGGSLAVADSDAGGKPSA